MTTRAVDETLRGRESILILSLSHHHRPETISTMLNVFSLTEPIITEGSPEFKVLEDEWTVVSLDNQRCLPLYV